MASTATTFDTDCKLMLHCDGADTSTTFTDSSVSAKTVTANGNAQIDTAQFKFGGASGLFDASANTRLTVADSSDWDFGTGDFTIDFWIRFSATGSNMGIFGAGGSTSGKGVSVSLVASGTTIEIIINGLGGGSHSWTPTIDTWYHHAIIRSGTTITYFVDGSSIGNAVNGADITGSTEGVSIAKTNGESTSALFNGLIDELRIVNGTAVWTAGFTSPVAAYTAPSVARPSRMMLMGIS